MFLLWFIFLLEGIIISIFKSYIADNCFGLEIFIITVHFIFTSFVIMRQNIGKNARLLSLAGILIRIAMIGWDIYCRDIYVLPNSGLDSEMYYYGAVNGYLYGQYGRSGGYGRFLAFWFRLFGVQRYCVQYTNVILICSTMLLVIRIMEELEINAYTKDLIVSLLMVLPNTILTNSILLRETLICFLVSFSLYSFIKWNRQGYVIYLVSSFGMALLASTIHSGAIAILFGEIIVMILYNRAAYSVQLNTRGVTVAVLSLALFVILYRYYGSIFLGKFQRVDSIESIMNTANLYNHGGAAYDAGFQINNSYLNLIINTPIRMLYFLISPMPWDWRGIMDIITFCFSSTVFVYSLWCAILEMKSASDEMSKSFVIVFLIFGLCAALIFAWGVSNAGTAVRHREKFIVVFLLLIAVCNDCKWKRIWESMNETY